MTEILTDSTAALAGGASVALADSLSAYASKAAADTAVAVTTASNVWMLICTAFVFIMSLGFACVEAGFTQAKNTVNILFKNSVDTTIGLLTYALFGFALMYPGDFNGLLGFAGFGLDPGPGYDPLAYAGGAYTYWTDYLFQAVFAATAATIVSGAVAERIKISAYFLFTFFLVGFIYPICGSWKWGAGWLYWATEGGAYEYIIKGTNLPGFYDFAGSTVVHSVGGWAALACIIVLGPRIGKYVDGKVVDKPGSSVPLAVIGVFLLWLGWFGFNGGSVLSADPELISLVCVTTCLAAAAGGIGGLISGLLVFKRLDLGMVLNGILAGLVGITAGADQMSPNESMLIGIVCGIVVVFSVVFLDKLKLDDCVGAVSVHLTCGIIGTLAVGVLGKLASMDQFLSQIIGIAAIGATTFILSFVIFYLIKLTMGVRVSAEHEMQGLDSNEHGIRGYTITFED